MPIIPRTKYDAHFTPKKETIEFFSWFSLFFDEENKTAAMHYQMIDFIQEKGRRKCFECTRGASKSTLVGVYYLLYCIFKGKKFNHGEVDVIVYIMDSVQQVASHITRVLYTIEENPNLKKYLKIRKSTLGNDPQIWIYNELIDRTIYLVGRGTGQKIRGINFMNKRPDWIIMDDIENDEQVATKEGREKLKAWFQAAVVPAVNPNKFEFTFIGTPLHSDSLLMNLVDSKEWKTIQLPVAEEYPVGRDKIVSCWADRFTPKYIEESYKSYKELGQQTLWFQEHMLVVTPSEGLLYNMDQIKRYKSSDMKKNLEKLTYYISLDLAVSEKTTADYTSVVVIGVNENNHWFLVDGTFGRFKPDDTIDKLFNFVVKYRPYAVVFEGVAFQMAMKTFIQNEMLARGVFFNLETVSRSTAKLSVLKSFQPIVELGRFWVPDDIMHKFVEELLNEMSMITEDKILSKHDDLIDSIAQLTLIPMITATPISQASFEDEGDVKDSYIF